MTTTTIEPLTDEELYAEAEAIAFRLDEGPTDDLLAAEALGLLGREAREIAEILRIEREELGTAA